LDWASIEAAYRRSLTLEPGNAESLLSYADFAGRLGRADALGAANRAVTLSPLDAESRTTRGVVQFHLRHYDDARNSFQEALKLEESARTRFWPAGMSWRQVARKRHCRTVRLTARVGTFRHASPLPTNGWVERPTLWQSWRG
jgi:tetratricopeptide (TPR) repeat protein